jgi:hypothetical protein
MDEEQKRLLEENPAVTRENNALLKEARRNAMIGLAVKVVLYLLLLGVPLFFISSYLGPLLTGSGSNAPTGLFGVPSPDQAQQLLKEYQSLYEGQ